MLRFVLSAGLLSLVLAPVTAFASSPASVALSKLVHQYHFEVIAQACVHQGLLDPSVVAAMQKSEARYAQLVPAGTDVAAAKAAVAANAQRAAAMVGPSAKLFCQGMAKEIF